MLASLGIGTILILIWIGLMGLAQLAGFTLPGWLMGTLAIAGVVMSFIGTSHRV